MAIRTKARGQKNKWKRNTAILLIITALFTVAMFIGLKYQRLIFAPNVNTGAVAKFDLFIPSHSTFEEVVGLLKMSGTIVNIDGFIWVSQKKGYAISVKPGRYVLENGMSNNELINLLRSGKQTPVNVTFNNIRTHEELAGQLAKRLEPDSIQFLEALNDKQALQTFDFEPSTVLAMILPNSYQMFWNTSAKGFISRMHQEYERFWNSERTEKAAQIGLSKLEVAILASIVDEETIKEDEKPVVAGLYLNRLNKGMRLQADPTIKFAIGDFTVTRILNKDLKTESPYNTYIYAGLPPGPIRMPSFSGIDGVLNHKKHNYLYMCAKDDFSGYHNFAQTLNQHNQNAAKYRNALRRLRIYR